MKLENMRSLDFLKNVWKTDYSLGRPFSSSAHSWCILLAKKYMLSANYMYNSISCCAAVRKCPGCKFRVGLSRYTHLLTVWLTAVLLLSFGSDVVF